MEEYKLPENKVLVLCPYDDSVQYPFGKGVEIINVEDSLKVRCGVPGFYGYLHGQGDYMGKQVKEVDGIITIKFDKLPEVHDKFVVVEVDRGDCTHRLFSNEDELVFTKGKVVFAGDLEDAAFCIRLCSTARQIIGESFFCTNGGIASVGNFGCASSGDNGVSISKYYGTSRTENSGVSICTGLQGTAVSENHGISMVGPFGKANSASEGISIAHFGGKACAGYKGIIIIHWLDGERMRTSVGYVGENGIKANTYYKCDEKGNLVEVKEE
jgi:hypothetical protein